jgi:hypothetical protein
MAGHEEIHIDIRIAGRIEQIVGMVQGIVFTHEDAPSTN